MSDRDTCGTSECYVSHRHVWYKVNAVSDPRQTLYKVNVMSDLDPSGTR